MTEYELMDLVASATSEMAEMFSLYLTVISAYLLVTYFVGASLSRLQALLLSGLFLFASSGEILGMRNTVVYIAELLARKTEFTPLTSYETDYVTNTNAWIMFMSIGILAALLFMWQVRHPKN